MRLESALIGHTGFVGSNLVEQHAFTECYNSKNLNTIAGKNIDLVVCAGVSAAKWLANQEPAADIESIEKLKAQVATAKIGHFVLISTVDIYDAPRAVDENSIPDTTKQDFYGKHRYQLEKWLAQQKNITSYSIIRLPGLFGQHLKKNLIFDIIHPLAKAINKNLWQHLLDKLNVDEQTFIKRYYLEDTFGNLQQKPDLNDKIKQELIVTFSKANFSTLSFTDSRSSFQFYHLANLWKDIQYVLSNKIRLLNLSSEPIMARELVQFVVGDEFMNLTTQGPVSYNMYSCYAKEGKYLYHKPEILKQIKAFVEAEK